MDTKLLATALMGAHDDIRTQREKIRTKIGTDAEQTALALVECMYWVGQRLLVGLRLDVADPGLVGWAGHENDPTPPAQ